MTVQWFCCEADWQFTVVGAEGEKRLPPFAWKILLIDHKLEKHLPENDNPEKNCLNLFSNEFTLMDIFVVNFIRWKLFLYNQGNANLCKLIFWKSHAVVFFFTMAPKIVGEKLNVDRYQYIQCRARIIFIYAVINFLKYKINFIR